MVNYIIEIDMFTHPKSVCLTYYQHFCFSMNVTKKLIIGSIKSFIHAIYPDIFITTTSDLLIELKNEMSEIGCRKNQD